MITAAEQKTQIVAAREEHLQPSRIFQGIPSITCTAKGRIFATWYSGEKGEHADNYVLLVHSDDGGVTWSDAEYVVLPEHKEIRAFDPTIFCSPDGRIFLFWAQSFSDDNETNPFRHIFDGHGGVWYTILTNPDDATEKFVFTECRRICDGIMMNKPTVLADGTWALPVAVWNLPPNFDDVQGYAPGTMMYASTDNGETFQFRGRTLVPAEKANFDEHSIYQLSDGRLAMLIRVLGGFMESFSSDNGCTWTEPQMSPIQGPCSRAYIGRLPSGKLLFVGNDDPGKRRNMTVALSDDDGKTWSQKILIDGREGCSYPDADVTPDGNILVIHDYNRYKGGNILFTRLTEEDITAGRLVNDESCICRLISSSKPVPAT